MKTKAAKVVVVAETAATPTPPSAPPCSTLKPVAGEKLLLAPTASHRISGAALRRAVEGLAQLTLADTDVVRDGGPGDAVLVYSFSLRVQGEVPLAFSGFVDFHALLTADGVDTAPHTFEVGLAQITRPLKNRILALVNNATRRSRPGHGSIAPMMLP